MIQEKRKKDKSKVRCGIIYQENIKDINTVAKEIESITDMYRNLSVIISPLHTPDKDQKKPHYHIIMESTSELNVDTYDKILEKYKGTKSIKVFNSKKYKRYLLHLDNPEKEQFKGFADDLIYINCNKSEVENELRTHDEIQIMRDIFEYKSIEGINHTIQEFLQYEYNSKNIAEYKEVLRYVASHGYIITQIMKGI